MSIFSFKCVAQAIAVGAIISSTLLLFTVCTQSSGPNLGLCFSYFLGWDIPWSWFYHLFFCGHWTNTFRSDNCSCSNYSCSNYSLTIFIPDSEDLPLPMLIKLGYACKRVMEMAECINSFVIMCQCIQKGSAVHVEWVTFLQLLRTMSCYYSLIRCWHALSLLFPDQVLAAWQRFNCMKGLPLAVAGRYPSPDRGHLFKFISGYDAGVSRWMDDHPNRIRIVWVTWASSGLQLCPGPSD